jgi:hypothetical protein
MLASTRSDNKKFRLGFTVLLLREWFEYQRLESGGDIFRRTSFPLASKNYTADYLRYWNEIMMQTVKTPLW